jgi:signal transduction histidine kinase
MGLVGMGAGCVYASASVMPSCFAFFYPSILLPAALFLRAHDSLHFIIGVLMIAYLSLMTPFALRVYRLIDESIKLRFENLGLIGELREQKEAAENANGAKSRFLAAAIHDLRQPLHALGLFVQALQETPLASRERQVIGNIRRSVDAMEELFNALLDISRLDAGVVQPHITTIPLASVFDRVRFEYAQIARQKPAEGSPEAAAFDLSHSLVLVIEATIQEGMAALLRKWKCDVLTAGSGAEMMSKLVAVQRLPDLIVSDYRLRGTENGIQVVEMLRNEFNVDIPAMLVSGDTAPDRLRDAEASGLPILHKPLNPARLRTLIANLLREHTRAA